MLCGGTMSLRRKFVQLGGFSVCFVHRVSSCGSAGNSLLHVHETGQFPLDGMFPSNGFESP
jgi:hypothetical protein